MSLSKLELHDLIRARLRLDVWPAAAVLLLGRVLMGALGQRQHLLLLARRTCPLSVLLGIGLLWGLPLPAATQSARSVPSCSWDHPGAQAFVGDLVKAVDRYTDIPAATRAKLKKRMAERRYDDLAVIQRDSIQGKHRYSAELRDMHFGNGRVCNTVTRSRWPAQARERGLVYCESGHCLMVPTVCRNLSRVTRLPGAPAPAEDGGGGDDADADSPGQKRIAAAPGGGLAAAPDNGELKFDPPGAGRSFNEGADAVLASLMASGGASARALAGPGLALPGAGAPAPDVAAAPEAEQVLAVGGGTGQAGGGSSGMPGLVPYTVLGWPFTSGGDGVVSVPQPIGAFQLPAGGGSILVPGLPLSPTTELPPTAAVPEPHSALLLLLGLLGLGALRKRRLAKRT